MVSADPVLIVKSHPQPAIESAEIRTDIAMSGLTISSSSDPSPSLARYAIMASLPSERMDMCHLSDDVKMFASAFKAGSDTFDFKQFMDSKAQRHWFILNDAEFKLWSSASCSSDSSCQRSIRWSHPQLEDSSVTSGCHLSHDLPHSGSLCSSWISGIIIRFVNDIFNCVRCHASRSPSVLRGRRFVRDQVAQPHVKCSWSSSYLIIHGSDSDLQSIHALCWAASGSTSAFMSSHVLYYESVSISDKYVSSSLSCVISHRTARLNERVYNLMLKFHPHLIMVFFQNQPGQEKEFKHSVTEFTVKPSFFIEALISSPHLDGLDQQASASAMQISSPSSLHTSAGIKPHGQVCGDQHQVIRDISSVSICGAQQSRVHRSTQSLRFTTVQVLNGSQALISLIMIKNGSVSSASEQLTSSSLLQHQVRPQSMKSRSALDFKGACQDIIFAEFISNIHTEVPLLIGTSNICLGLKKQKGGTSGPCRKHQ